MISERKRNNTLFRSKYRYIQFSIEFTLDNRVPLLFQFNVLFSAFFASPPLLSSRESYHGSEREETEAAKITSNTNEMKLQ